MCHLAKVSLPVAHLASARRFMEEVDKEISEMKLSLNARARIVAESYLTAVSQFCFVELILIKWSTV